MPSKPRRRNGEVAMNQEMTDDNLDACLFLSGATAATSLVVRNTNFIKKLLDEALDFMDDEEKARIIGVSSDIAHVRGLFQSALLDLALIDDDLDPESDDEADGDAE